ncbi:MAG TPA: hypothetical protein VGP24_09740 [Glaciihabitans sp.]|nr:hypothetical protein [Glaciihabitans sp.]
MLQEQATELALLFLLLSSIVLLISTVWRYEGRRDPALPAEDDRAIPQVDQLSEHVSDDVAHAYTNWRNTLKEIESDIEAIDARSVTRRP